MGEVDLNIPAKNRKAADGSVVKDTPRRIQFCFLNIFLKDLRSGTLYDPSVTNYSTGSKVTILSPGLLS